MSWPQVSLRRMFGADCFLVRGRMFAFAHEGGFVVKLPEEGYRQALARPGAAPFTMRGVPFGKWARLAAGDDTLSWLRLAYEHVLAEPPARRRKQRPRPLGG